MPRLSRRDFLAAASALGATLAYGISGAASAWREARDAFPEGVASGDPHGDSVLLWTRCPAAGEVRERALTVEVADDAAFTHLVTRAKTSARASADWTCRVLVAGLSPSREYWYRFIDDEGRGSRIGRTLTAPALTDTRAVRFVFVSCQDCTSGAQNAYRRMMFEDARAPRESQIEFILHLGDFVYEVVNYPEEHPQGLYDRQLREVVRYRHGEKIPGRNFHIPTDVDDYRALYRGYLADPDIQDARARWPFVNMWDNHEFSWLGWQSLEVFNDVTRPAQTRKVAALQAFFEFQPGRFRKASGPSLEEFSPPLVHDAPVTRFDEHGLGLEPNNLAAIGSLTGYRTVRWGANVDLFVTDQRSYRSKDPIAGPVLKVIESADVPELVPEEAARMLDAGRTWNGGAPPAEIVNGAARIANPQREEPAQTLLGATQKAWFLEELRNSRATWKIWANTIATLDARGDPQNLPSALRDGWPSGGYGAMTGDFASAFSERAEIYDWVRSQHIANFVTIAGDRHAFFAGLAAKALPPAAFEPVGIAFVTGSISAPTVAEALEYVIRRDHPLRPLYVGDNPAHAKPEATLNLLVLHGVRTCLEYASSRDLKRARNLSNRELAPHLAFCDFSGHGYSVVTATSEWIDTEFVCIPRPLTRATEDSGGPLRYRVSHRARSWRAGERPVLTQRVLEGDPQLSLGTLTS